MAETELRVMPGGAQEVGAYAPPAVAAPMNDEQRRILKQTAGGGELSDDEFVMFLTVAARLGLDPLTKQIVAVKFMNKRTHQKEMTLIVPITGMRTVCQRTGLDDGVVGPEYTADGLNWTEAWLAPEPPAAARCTVYRKGASHPYTGVALFSEFAKRYPDGNLEEFWKRMPVHMIGKCSEANARRMAFADQLSGVYAPEEFGKIDADNVVDAEVTTKPKVQAAKTKPAITTPTTEQEVIAYLWNNLEADRRPAKEVMQAYGKKDGKAGQIHFLITNHLGIHGDDCPHITARMQAMAAAVISGDVPEQASGDVRKEQVLDAAGEGDEDGGGGTEGNEFAL